jgi:hypothetical protein
MTERPDPMVLLTTTAHEALAAFDSARARHDPDSATYWLGACVALTRVLQAAGGHLPETQHLLSMPPRTLPDVQDDPLAQWQQEQAARQEQARRLYQIILDQAPDDAIATLAAALRAVVEPQLAVQIERRAQQLYDFLDMAQGIEQSPDDHQEREHTVGLVFDAQVTLER